MKELTSAARETLIALIEQGPLWDGDVPSKSGRDALLEKGYAVCVVVQGEDGWQAATYRGRDAYKEHFGADTLREAVRTSKPRKCCVCGTTKNLFDDGWYGFRCHSVKCMVY